MSLKSKYLNVNSFHNYGVTKLPNKFNIIAMHKDKSIEITEHKDYKILCMMFHPERANNSQKKIDLYLKKFLK